MTIGYAEEAEAGGSGVGGQLRIHLLGQPGDLAGKSACHVELHNNTIGTCAPAHTSQYDNDK